MNFRVNKNLLLQTLEENELMNNLLHQGGTGETGGVANQELFPNPFKGLGDKFKQIITDFKSPDILNHGTNAVGENPHQIELRKLAEKEAERNSELDQIERETGLDVRNLSNEFKTDEELKNSMTSEIQKSHDNFMNHPELAEKQRIFELKQQLNHNDFKTDNELKNRINSEIRKSQDNFMNHPEDAVKQKNFELTQQLKHKDQALNNVGDAYEDLTKQLKHKDQALNSVGDAYEDLAKHPEGKKVFGSEYIANKLNNLTTNQRIGATLGAGAVLGTSGHILGTKLANQNKK